MQSSIKNTIGEFTVFGNAEVLANGSLNPTVLRMNVWKDPRGKVMGAGRQKVFLKESPKLVV